MSYLRLDGLTMRFGSFTAVAGIELEVRRGEFLSLLGPSGCGKTTTLQMIAGLLQPTAGRILLDGRDLGRVKPAQRGLGVVFQSYALFPHMTAAENVAFGLEMRGVAKPERARRVKDALELVGLSGFGERFPRKLSGGQQQRVALARALVIRPQLLLLDEPLSNLDAKLREEMQIELRRIQHSVGVTTILVTHDQAEAMALSDRIVVMNQGRIEQEATPQGAYDAPASPFVANFLGRTNVLPGRVERNGAATLLHVGEASWSLPAATALEGPVQVNVRPERLRFGAEGGLPGRVKTRIFQGTQWLYEIEGPAGRLVLVCQNDGAALPPEEAEVRIDWRVEDLRLLPAAADAAR